MTIGVSRSASGANLLDSSWFDGGLVMLGVGGLLLVWALLQYLARRRIQATPPTKGDPHAAKDGHSTEAIRGYYAERDKLFKLWDRQQRERHRRPKV